MNGWRRAVGLHLVSDPSRLAYRVAHNTAHRVAQTCEGQAAGMQRQQGARTRGASDPEASSPRSCYLAQGGTRHLDPHHREPRHSSAGRPTIVSHPGQAHPAGPAYPVRRPQRLCGGSGVPGERERESDHPPRAQLSSPGPR